MPGSSIMATHAGRGGRLVTEWDGRALNVWIAREGDGDGPSVVFDRAQVLAIYAVVSAIRADALARMRRDWPHPAEVVE